MTQTLDIHNDVLIGRDGELYLASGGHRVLEYALGKRAIDPRVVKTFQENISRRAALVTENGSKYCHVLFPDKQSVICSRFAVADPICLGTVYLDDSDAKSHVLYPLYMLREASGDVYQRTDSHLSDLGSILVATQLAERLTGCCLVEHQTKLLDLLTIRRTRVGDLGIKLDPPRSHEETFARTTWFCMEQSNDIPGGNNGGIAILVSPDALSSDRLLLFGDSFCRGIARFLTYFFREILFLRTPFMHDEFVHMMKPTYVVTGNVERYLASCAPDANRPPFHMFPFLSRGTVTGSPEFARAYIGITSFPDATYQSFLAAATAAARSSTAT